MNVNYSVKIRDVILDIARISQEGHIGSSFSIVEILVACLIPFDVINPHDRKKLLEAKLRKFILSKGHSVLALYAVMAEFGIISTEEMFSIAGFDSSLGGHPSRQNYPPIPVSTGSLGHGFPVAAGMAFSDLHTGKHNHYFCLCGDGELNEGSIWETLLLVNKFKLSNLTLIVDNNRSSTRAIDLGNLTEKISSFGMSTIEVDGHDISAISKAIDESIAAKRPNAIVANTIKGYGSAVTMNKFEWHHKVPTDNDISNIKNSYIF